MRVGNTKFNFVTCHRLPERSFFWKGEQFPVCARCTGIYLGYLTMPFFVFCCFGWGFWFSLLLFLPTIIDGGIQAFFNIESTNFRRLTTGIISGMGIMSLTHLLGFYIAKQIFINLIN